MTLGVPAARGGALPTIAGIASGLAFGTVPSLSVYLLRDGMAVPSLLFWRFGLGLALALPFALWIGWRAPFAWRDGWKLILVGGLLGGLQSYCFFRSVEYLPTSIAAPIMYTFPALTLIADRLLYGVLFTRLTLISVALIVGGAAAITLTGLQSALISPLGLSWVMPVPFIYAAYLMLNARLMADRPSLVSVAYLNIGFVALFGMVVSIRGLDSPNSATGWGVLLLVATCGGIVAMTLFSYSVSRLGGSHYGIISCIELATAVMIGTLALQETLAPIELAGVILVIGGVMLRAISGFWPLRAEA